MGGLSPIHATNSTGFRTASQVDQVYLRWNSSVWRWNSKTALSYDARDREKDPRHKADGVYTGSGAAKGTFGMLYTVEVSYM